MLPAHVDAEEELRPPLQHGDPLPKRGVSHLEGSGPAQEVDARDAIVDAVSVLVPDERLRRARAPGREEPGERAREQHRAPRQAA